MGSLESCDTGESVSIVIKPCLLCVKIADPVAVIKIHAYQVVRVPFASTHATKASTDEGKSKHIAKPSNSRIPTTWISYAM